MKKGTDVIREVSTNDQTGVTSHNSALMNLNIISRRQQSSFMQGQQNTNSMQDDIVLDEKSLNNSIQNIQINEEDTPRGDTFQSENQNLSLNESQRNNAQQFWKQISRQNKILENQAFLLTCHKRKYFGQNNQMPTVVIETDSEDVATFKGSKRLRVSGQIKLMSQASNINMLNDQDSVLNDSSAGFSKKGTNQLQQSQKGSSGDSGGYRLNEIQHDHRQNFVSGIVATSSSNTQNNIVATSHRINTLPKKFSREDSQNINLEQLQGLIEVDEDDDDKRSYHALTRKIQGEQIKDSGIMIELASRNESSKQNSRNKQNDEDADSIFTKTEDQISSIGHSEISSEMLRYELKNDDNVDEEDDYHLNDDIQSNISFNDDKDDDDKNYDLSKDKKKKALDPNSPMSLKKRKTLLMKNTISFIWGKERVDSREKKVNKKKNTKSTTETLKTDEEIEMQEILGSVQKIKDKMPITYYGYSFNRMNQATLRLNKKENKLIIQAMLKEKSKRFAYQKNETDMRIKLRYINGLILGPQSITYQILINKHKLEDLTENYWSFLSIVTEERTYDIQFAKKSELIDFFIGMNHCIAKVKKSFAKIVNRRFIKIHLYRMKLEHIAEIQGLSLIQLFKKALYLRAQELPEVTVNDRKYKFQIISKLNGIVQYTPVVNYIELNDLYNLSQALIQDALQQEQLEMQKLFGGDNVNRDDSTYMNEVQSISYQINPMHLNQNGPYLFSTLNTEINPASIVIGNNFQNKLQEDQEEQWKVGRIKQILATSIRSIQRTNLTKANERKSILATNQVSKRFKSQLRPNNNQTYKNQMNRTQFQNTANLNSSMYNSNNMTLNNTNAYGGISVKNNQQIMNTSFYGQQSKLSDKMIGNQSDTSMFSPKRRLQMNNTININDLPEFNFDGGQDISNKNNSNSRQQSQNNNQEMNKSVQFQEGNSKLMDTNHQGYASDGMELGKSTFARKSSALQNSRSRSRKRRFFRNLFRSIKKQSFFKQQPVNQVLLLISELTKVFNLSKKFYMSLQRRFPKDIRVKMEEALDQHLKKKVDLVNKMADQKAKIEYLRDIIDFYIRHCDQESEHFNIVTQRVIDLYIDQIPKEIIEERLRRRVDYNQLRMKAEQIKFNILQQQQLQQQLDNSHTDLSQSMILKGGQATGGNFNITLIKQQHTYGNITGSVSNEPSTPMTNRFKQIVQMKRFKTKRMELF